MQGIFHAYYTVALAPAIGALVGMGAVLLWRARRDLAVALVARRRAVARDRLVWAFVLLGRSADFLPWLRWPTACSGSAAGLVGGWSRPSASGRCALGWVAAVPWPRVAALARRRWPGRRLRGADRRRRRTPARSRRPVRRSPGGGPGGGGRGGPGRRPRSAAAPAAAPGRRRAGRLGGPGTAGGTPGAPAAPGRAHGGTPAGRRRRGGGRVARRRRHGRSAQRRRTVSAELVALLDGRRRPLHLGGGRRRRPTTPPATSWPPASR